LGPAPDEAGERGGAGEGGVLDGHHGVGDGHCGQAWGDWGGKIRYIKELLGVLTVFQLFFRVYLVIFEFKIGFLRFEMVFKGSQ
jgi:hypothetical protein